MWQLLDHTAVILGAAAVTAPALSADWRIHDNTMDEREEMKMDGAEAHNWASHSRPKLGTTQFQEELGDS